MLGNPDPARRIGIVSFNLRDARGRYLHPKFVTVLLNDLFGIQSRAGCSCAGPYGHRLLGIDQPTSELYRDWVRKGFQGIKPGWCRVGFHYAMDDAEADFVIDAVEFVATHGYRFLPLYSFDANTGLLVHIVTHESSTKRFRWTRPCAAGPQGGTSLPWPNASGHLSALPGRGAVLGEPAGRAKGADRDEDWRRLRRVAVFQRLLTGTHLRG